MKKMKIGPVLKRVETVLTGSYRRQYNIVIKEKPFNIILKTTCLKTISTNAY